MKRATTRAPWRRPLLAALLLLLVVPGHARAQDTEPGAEAEPPTLAPRVPHGRAVVFLEGSEDVDAFTKIYLYEVIAGRLREHGFAVTAGDAGDEPRPPLECLADPACGTPLAQRLEAPLVLAFVMSPAEDGQLQLRWRRSDQPAEAPEPLVDSEGAVAAALYTMLSSLDPAAVPCLATLATEVAGVQVHIDDAEVSLPTLVGAGQHDARAEAPDRAGWRGPLVCEGGRVLRVRVD